MNRIRIGAAVVFILLIIINPILLWLGTTESVDIAWSVATIGMLTFLAMLAYAYFWHDGLDAGDTRRAIAVSVTVVYFILVAMVTFTDLGDSPERMKWIYDNFTVIVVTVIGFYFGGTAAEKVAQIRRTSQTAPGQGTS